MDGIAILTIIIILIILAMSALVGNIEMVMALFVQDSSPIKENGFLVFVAIIADIALVGYIISACIKGSKRRQEEEEKQRISEVTQKVNELLARYSLQKTISLQKAQQINTENSLVNKEVVSTVNQFKDSLRDNISKCNEIDQAINRILTCVGCRDVDEKLNYLSAKAEELQRLKCESDKLHNEIAKHRIKLLNEDGNLLFLVKKSLNALFSSKKCVIEGLNLKELICEEKPSDLEFFDYKYAPATLHIGTYYYCLFSNVILVFDAMGIFATAIDPTALFIQIERVSVDVRINNNTLPSHQYIDVDSKCVEQGTTRHTWVHTCRDGSPDLRYSYNPRIEYRTDKYEYGNVTMSILGNTVSFSLSSDNATKALERVSREYIRKCNNRHNPIPEFLNLLDRVSENGEQNITYILDINKSNVSAANYFCIMG